LRHFASCTAVRKVVSITVISVIGFGQVVWLGGAVEGKRGRVGVVPYRKLIPEKEFIGTEFVYNAEVR
jgi:hypothetical protein